MQEPNGHIEPEELRQLAYQLLDDHWLVDGYTMPNRATYPWQWLWDSCFHSIVWSELGDERALIELAQLFRFQTAQGFVPHMNYHPDPGAAREFWGRDGASTITQPPMYGHAIAELVARGMQPRDEVLESAVRGLRYLFTHRRKTAGGLIELCHPWESGCDDSARWDANLQEPWQRERWRERKHELVGAVETDDEGGAIHNDQFAVGSVGFCALVAFNALELDAAVGSTGLAEPANELIAAISSRWDDHLATWVDDGALAATSGRARTTDAYFALLVDHTEPRAQAATAQLIDPAAYGGACGPAGSHRDEPTYDPVTYWRGPAWPQMSYLLWVALRRGPDGAAAASVGAGLRNGSLRSGFAEFWHPDSGLGCGAIPQSWATLSVMVDAAG